MDQNQNIYQQYMDRSVLYLSQQLKFDIESLSRHMKTNYDMMQSQLRKQID
jgi:hypothetical protein